MAVDETEKGAPLEKAVELARLIEAPHDPSMIVAVAALCRPYAPAAFTQTGAGGLTAIAGLPPLAARQKLARAVEPAVVGVFLAALRDHLVAALDHDGTPGPDLMTTADAFVGVADWLASAAIRAPVEAQRQEISRAIQARATLATTELKRLMEPSGDFPDVNTVTMDLLRLEGLAWLAEALKLESARKALGQLSRRTARVTLTRATKTIQVFLGSRDLYALFDNAAIISQVDNLLVVTDRVLDAILLREEEATAFVATSDETALATFVLTLANLSDMLYALLSRAMAKPNGGRAFFVSLVRQMESVYRFCKHLKHAARPPQLDSIEEALRAKLMALAGETARAVAGWVEAAVAAGTPFEEALTPATELLSALRRVGLDAEAGPLALRIRAARQIAPGQIPRG